VTLPDPGPDPIAAVRRELARARTEEVFDADRAALATVDASGRPAVRILFVREIDDDGFVFYTNYESDKGRDLAGEPRASLVWHWASTGVQARAEGEVSKVSAERSDRYFASRPRDSQVGAWASRQSRPLASRAELDAEVERAAARFDGGPVPRPPHWGGYKLVPTRVELWYTHPDRLHDRYVFVRRSEEWARQMLFP
jgi:pyridoxamine 5'-phosphate oxidase